MPVVTVSRRFQVTIPRSVRQSLKIEPGQRVRIFASDGRIEIVAEQSPVSLRGFLKGLDTEIPRTRRRFRDAR
jgi:AbrB family looped-hinge helix DNA binding protein